MSLVLSVGLFMSETEPIRNPRTGKILPSMCKRCGIVLDCKCERCSEAHGERSPDGKHCQYCFEQLNNPGDLVLQP